MILSKITWSVAAALALVWACQSIEIEPKEPTAFEKVCAMVEHDFEVQCGDMTPPITVVSDIVPKNFNGLYFPGEKFIFINPDSTVPLEAVEVHETVHYVLDVLNLARERCESEAFARDWTALIAGVPVDPTWRLRYGCGIQGLTIINGPVD